MNQCDSFFRQGDQWLHFNKPVEIISVDDAHQVHDALQRADEFARRGLYCAGYIAYEAAPGFDPALKTNQLTHLPLVNIAVYNEPDLIDKLPVAPRHAETKPWRPLVAPDQYQRAFKDIMDNIDQGNTYQINYTFPVETEFEGDTDAWFAALCGCQPTSKAAFLRFDDKHILSLSPELFFSLNGDTLKTSPMKGTRPRGKWYSQDIELRDQLPTCEKERAENVMIVDMLRNDLGRISLPGSVNVDELFKVQKYPTVWQMTSTISSKTSACVPEILAAIFPCGSVTGAPKVRSMQIIRDLEQFPRGVYCGAVGWWTQGRAFFNVPIRTAVADLSKNSVRYNVGSGITFDSKPDREYQECLTKAQLLSGIARNDFDLLESLLYKDGEYFLFEKHISRLMQSACYFDFAIDEETVRNALLNFPIPHEGEQGSFKVRLTAAKDGNINIEAAAIEPTLTPVKVSIAAKPIDENNVFYYHKTTNRKCYTDLNNPVAQAEQTIFYNSKGLVTESTTANIVARIDGELVTPPLSCGLLGGTYRNHLLDTGKIKERQFTVAQLKICDEIWLINSVRKWIKVQLV